MKITSETPGTIRYTTDGNEPDETSQAYTDVLHIPEGNILKARVYPENTEIFVPSDVESVELGILEPAEISIGNTLPDGSIVAYDRGTEYGDYSLFNGYPIRISQGIDDGTAESSNWRYIIIHKKRDNADTAVRICDNWTQFSTSRGIGTGLANTKIIKQHTVSTDTIYVANLADSFTAIDGYEWFLPSIEEMKSIFANVRDITDFVQDLHFTSSMDSSSKFIAVSLIGSESYFNYDDLLYCRLARRI